MPYFMPGIKGKKKSPYFKGAKGLSIVHSVTVLYPPHEKNRPFLHEQFYGFIHDQEEQNYYNRIFKE
jgi:hypothetical protein